VLVTVAGVTAKTNQNGDWSVTLPTGDYNDTTVHFTANNYSDNPYTDAFIINNSSTTYLPTVTLISETGTVTGTVKDLNTNKSIASAFVQVIAGNVQVNTVTDENGSFSLVGIPVGIQKITAFKEGHGTGALSALIKAGEKVALENAILLTPYYLGGKVVLKDSLDDSSGISVTLVGSEIPSTTTTTDGSFTLYGVGQGNYELQLSLAGYVTKKVPLAISSENGYTIPYDIELERAIGTLSGMVTLNNKTSKFSGITVNIPGTSYTTTTNSLGMWSMDIPIGQYINGIQFSYPNYESVSYTQNYSIDIGKTTNIEDQELIAKTGKLTGKIVDEEGNSITNVLISAYTTYSSIETHSKQDGTFEIIGIPFGEQAIYLSKDGYKDTALNINLSSDISEIILDSSVVLSKLKLTGKIKLANKEDYSGATVALIGSTIPSAVSLSDGNFTLYGVGTGNYQLQITKAGYITQTIPLVVNSDEGYNVPYTIDIELSKSTIEGTATLNGKLSSSGVKVEIIGTDYFTYTDSTGKWSINVAVGNYSDGVRFSKDLFETKVATETATVVENGTYNVTSVSLSQLYQNLKGSVTVAGSTDYSSVTVALSGFSGEANGITADTTVDTNGDFSLTNLPLGEYKVTISLPDGLHESVIKLIELDGSSDELDLGTINLRSSFVKINNGDEYTNSKNVTLSIGNSDAVQMQITEGGTTYPKENITSSKNITLSNGDGIKTVTVNFFDANRDAISGLDDTIILDTNLIVLNN
jgi:hypothetical protein